MLEVLKSSFVNKKELSLVKNQIFSTFIGNEFLDFEFLLEETRS